MKYVKYTCSNGFCGCDEEFYEVFQDNATEEDINEYGYELLQNAYSFYEPDDRFIDMEDDEAYEYYQQDCSFDWKEISIDEFNENKG